MERCLHISLKIGNESLHYLRTALVPPSSFLLLNAAERERKESG